MNLNEWSCQVCGGMTTLQPVPTPPCFGMQDQDQSLHPLIHIGHTGLCSRGHLEASKWVHCLPERGRSMATQRRQIRTPGARCLSDGSRGNSLHPRVHRVHTGSPHTVRTGQQLVWWPVDLMVVGVDNHRLEE